LDLLHAGCGGGMVDDDIVKFARITAVDFSSAAIASYSGRHGENVLCVVVDICQMAIKDSSFDGIYNLGVMEHFHREGHIKILGEFRRVLKPNGKILLIWPPRFGLSVIFLKLVHWLANDVLKREIHLHPPEPSLLKSRKWLERLMEENGFEVISYYFGPRDLFTQCAIVARVKK
jgi:SAM-dependent methyltransferase